MHTCEPARQAHIQQLHGYEPKPREKRMASPAACRDGDNNTRFPLLATVRYLVAIVVTALAAAVVVMVVIFVRRPVELGFQSYGYVQTQDYWWRSWTPDNVTYGYEPAEEVQLLIELESLNPSGRGEIQGKITLIRILDITDDEVSTPPVELCRYYPGETLASFDLQPHSSHRYRRWVSITQRQQPALQYLYDRHRNDGSLGFPVMVVFNTTYDNKPKPAAHSADTAINVTFYCGQVTFLRGDADTPAAEEVACKTTKEMGYEVSSYYPPSSPPPQSQPPLAAGN